ncbi:hypothetical protein ACWT_3167 [Actinoplanes sp. SE50]|uniref:TIGR00374 family protein n=1 Tax=unclassified Actinoplanes TaxID=2626549 RepID=UPI00023EC60D|nr:MULTISPECIES: TIGR00374 family protein [unclassified Actinoplanes]AEV84190.1 hypothetical protein ACPL_3295 [Actinoplanes sp. SE50/110]ATO82582.1 hypothetical protein ACWT_3167 [Actinoplanes sp. SE50]SLL99989.1 hypothetical protein ACSP50_3221 [Actinoplanes sp. SE50/110]
MTTTDSVRDQPPRTAPANRRGGWWKLPVLALAGCLAVHELQGHLPGVAATWTALRQTRAGWLTAAVLLQVISTVAFAEEERRLLGAFGVPIAARTSVAVTLVRSAMATSLPGGSAVAAAYGFRQFRARGASRPIAATVTALCGAASVTGLAVLYAGDALVQAGDPRVIAIMVAAVTGLALGVRTLRRHPPPAGEPATALARVRRGVHETLVASAAVRVPQWLAILALAVLNWLADLVCLIACLHALNLRVPIAVLGTAYLGAQLARQIPATPGGIGVIEAALILAVTTAGGAAAAPATAAVLLYRLLSCWLQLPLGAACWAVLRTPPSPAVEPPTPADLHGGAILHATGTARPGERR